MAALSMLGLLGLVVQICPRQAEGFTYALMVSISNLAMSLGLVIGGQLYDWGLSFAVVAIIGVPVDVSPMLSRWVWGTHALPVYWQILNKLGSSDLQVQKRLVKAVLPLFKNYPVLVLGDREFHSPKLAQWLSARGVSFVLRQKKNLHLQTAGNSDYQLLKPTFRTLKCHTRELRLKAFDTRHFSLLKFK